MITLDTPKKKSIAILGAGWIGRQLLTSSDSATFELKASTTQAEKLLNISETDAEAYLIKLPESVPTSFLDSDVLVITLPPPKGPNAELFHVEQLKCISTFRGNVIYTSSISVYGNPLLLSNITEDSELMAETASAKTVVAAETYLRTIFKERLTILRLGGLIGHDRNPGRFLAGRSGLPEAESPVNLVTGEDVVNAIYKVISLNVFGKLLNIVSDEHPTRKKYYTMQARNMGLPLPEFDTQQPNVAGKIVSNEMSKALLGLSYTSINI